MNELMELIRRRRARTCICVQPSLHRNCQDGHCCQRHHHGPRAFARRRWISDGHRGSASRPGRAAQAGRAALCVKGLGELLVCVSIRSPGIRETKLSQDWPDTRWWADPRKQKQNGREGKSSRCRHRYKAMERHMTKCVSRIECH